MQGIIFLMTILSAAGAIGVGAILYGVLVPRLAEKLVTRKTTVVADREPCLMRQEQDWIVNARATVKQ